MIATALLDSATQYARDALHSPAEMLAVSSVLVAGGFVLAGGFVKTMIPLRWLAIGSNIGFVVYGAVHPSYPMLLLHGALLPINVYRLIEMVRLTRRVAAVAADGLSSGLWLRPYMRSAHMAASSLVFRKGDFADRLYLLVAGRIDLEEIGKSVAPGEIFGEIAFFAPDRKRRLTARCATDATVLSIDERTVKQLFYQNPAFGFKLIELVGMRLSADVERLAADRSAPRPEDRSAG